MTTKVAKELRVGGTIRYKFQEDIFDMGLRQAATLEGKVISYDEHTVGILIKKGRIGFATHALINGEAKKTKAGEFILTRGRSLARRVFIVDVEPGLVQYRPDIVEQGLAVDQKGNPASPGPG